MQKIGLCKNILWRGNKNSSLYIVSIKFQASFEKSCVRLCLILVIDLTNHTLTSFPL